MRRKRERPQVKRKERERGKCEGDKIIIQITSVHFVGSFESQANDTIVI
jgi:hypothetical protein